MSQLDILNLARSCGQATSSDFAQVITIIYTCGMLAYLGMMLLETNVAFGAQEALRAIPVAAQELPTQYYLGVRSSWVGTTSRILFNLVYWVLWLGTGYLLFFWKKPREIASSHD